MKEITRIHLAKIAYSIELAAKKQLEAYLQAVETYSGDTDIVDDVELRITELLAGQGIKKDDVITAEAVTALKSQLGEPEDFRDTTTDEDEVAHPAGGTKQLFRDDDRRLAGGVLAGMAAYFNVNVMWLRAAFILLMIASFGTALLVYVVLWIAVPLATTTADRLQMTGKPVTIEAIREQAALQAEDPPRRRDVNRFFTIMAGILSVAAATGAVFVTLLVLFMVLFRYSPMDNDVAPQPYYTAIGLFAAAGLLLATLFILTAYASFARRLGKRIITSMCAVIVAGILTFGAGIGAVTLGASWRDDFISNNTHSVEVAIPAGQSFSGLQLHTPDMMVEYEVTTEKPHMTLTGVAKKSSQLPNVQVKKAGKQLIVESSLRDCSEEAGCAGPPPVLTIYGPVLTSIDASGAVKFDYTVAAQKSLRVTTKSSVGVSLYGTIDQIESTLGESSMLSLNNATVRAVNAELQSNASLYGGTVENLELRLPMSCPADSVASVSFENVTKNTIVVNDKTQPSISSKGSCYELQIGEMND